jgi:putative two-component system response regulator
MEQSRNTCLLIDDEPAMRRYLARALPSDLPGGIAEASTGAEGLAALSLEKPDLVLLDLGLPDMSGEEVLSKALREEPELAVIVVSGHGDLPRAVSAMRLGALDYLRKPVLPSVLRAAVYRALDRVYERRELGTLRDLTKALVALIELKDPHLQEHGSRVAALSAAIATRMALEHHDVKLIEYAALVHDVGKIYLPEEILLGRGELTPEQWGLVRRHPRWSHDALRHVPLLRPALGYVLHHHERIDGRGYPSELTGDEIPLGARIIAVADSYDAMTSNRSYRGAMASREAEAILRKNAGTQWDERIVDLFLEVLHEQPSGKAEKKGEER